MLGITKMTAAIHKQASKRSLSLSLGKEKDTKLMKIIRKGIKLLKLNIIKRIRKDFKKKAN